MRRIKRRHGDDTLDGERLRMQARAMLIQRLDQLPPLTPYQRQRAAMSPAAIERERMTTKARVRRWRARHRAGEMPCVVTVPEYEVIEALVAAGHVTVDTHNVRVGGRVVPVRRLRITEEGRRHRYDLD